MALQRIRMNPVPKDLEKKQNILYVEDEDDNWEVAKLALGKTYKLTRAKTAKEVFEVLAQQRFEIILMDIQLSGSVLDGIEITKILRGNFHEKPPEFASDGNCHGARIVFVTAYSAKYNRKELIALGGDELITKPVDFTRLSLAISRLVVREAFDEQVEVKKFLAQNKKPEQREKTRVDLELDCALTHEETTYHGLIHDLSELGASVRFESNEKPTKLRAGNHLHVSFSTAWGRIDTEATIAWTNIANKSILGLSFSEMPEECISILKRWLTTEDSPS